MQKITPFLWFDQQAEEAALKMVKLNLKQLKQAAKGLARGHRGGGWMGRSNFVRAAAYLRAGLVIGGLALGLCARAQADDDTTDYGHPERYSNMELHAAALQGHSWSQQILGERYRDGQGLPRDYAKALELFQKAAAKQCWGAEWDLSDLYRKGLGVPVDMAKALLWLKAAARDGDNFAWVEIGDCYRDGSGTAQDFVAASNAYQKASDSGDGFGDQRLGLMLAKGLGREADLANAEALYERGTHKDHGGWTYFNFGDALLNGTFGAPDPAHAKPWLQKALAARVQIAAMDLERIAKLEAGQAKGPGAPGSQGAASPVTWSWTGVPAVIARATRPVAADGSLAGFEAAPKLIFNAATAGNHLVELTALIGQFWASAQLMHDNENLYLGVNVVQDAPPTNQGTIANDLWNGDSIELFICARSALTRQSRSTKCADDYQYMIAPTSMDGRARIFGANHPSSAVVASQRTQRGYTLCATIPLKDMDNLDWKSGDLVRFELSVGKAGPNGQRAGKICFAATDEAFDNPDKWGLARIE